METGTEISPFYDSLIAKLMVHGRTRDDAIQKMQRALASTRLGGIPTNLEYLKAILAAEGYAAGAPPAARCPSVWAHSHACSGLHMGALGPLSAIAMAGATTTRFLESLPFSPHAIEVVAPGMGTTVQVRHCSHWTAPLAAQLFCPAATLFGGQSHSSSRGTCPSMTHTPRCSLPAILGHAAQDYPGRVGYWHVGVPPSGPMDSNSFRLANALVGNPEDAAGLEISLAGATRLRSSDHVLCPAKLGWLPALKG